MSTLTPNGAAPAGGSSDPAVAPLTRRELGGAVLGCALAVTLFLSPALFTGRYLSPADLLYQYLPWMAQPPAPSAWPRFENGGLYDSIAQFEPWLRYTARQVGQGQVPLWNPDNMLGAPFLGNMQSAVFYPPNWPAILWPGGALLAVRAWLKLLLAALGTYLFARQGLRVGPPAAMVAAVAFALGAFMVNFLVWPHSAVAAWLPWLWWASGRLVAGPTARHVALLAGLVAFSLLAGHPETSYQVALATGLWVLFRLAQEPGGWGTRLRRGGLWAAAYTLGAALAAVQVLPFVEYLGQSAVLATRGQGLGLGFTSGLRYLWTLVSPDLYGNPVHQASLWDPTPRAFYGETNIYPGLLVLLLAPLAVLAHSPMHRRLGFFLLLLGGLAAGVAYDAPLLGDAASRLPLFDVATDTRLLLLAGWALALLAALGVEALQDRLAGALRRLLALVGRVAGLLALGGIVLPWLAARGFFQVPLAPAAAISFWQGSLLRAAALLLISSGLLLAVVILARARPQWTGGLLGVLPVLLWADLAWARGADAPTAAPADYYPATAVTQFLQQQPDLQTPGQGRFAATHADLPPETNLVYGLTDLRGYDGMMPPLYRDLAGEIEPYIKTGPGGLFRPFNTLYSPLLNLLNVRYVLVSPGEDPNDHLVLQADTSTTPLGEILPGRRVGQTFVAPSDNLTAIQVLGATYGHALQGRVIFHLKTDPAAPTDLATRTLDAATVPSNAFWLIRFPPIHATAGRQFYFELETQATAPDHAPTFWYSDHDAYTAGTRLEGGQPVAGDLAFRLVAGTDPADPWFVRVLDGDATGASIFANRHALPRTWLVHQVAVAPDPAARLTRLADLAFDPRRTALLNAPLPPTQPLPAPPDGAAPPADDVVTITRYTPQTVEIATRSPAASLLVLSDLLFPGWTVTIDDQPGTIVAADHALRGVYLPAGAHAVRFVYAPLSFWLGAAVSGGALLVVGLLVFVPWRRRRFAVAGGGAEQ